MVLISLSLITGAQCSLVPRRLTQRPSITVESVGKPSLTSPAFAGICVCMSRLQQVLAIMPALPQTQLISKPNLTQAFPILPKITHSPLPIQPRPHLPAPAPTRPSTALSVERASRKRGISSNMVSSTLRLARMAAPPAPGRSTAESHSHAMRRFMRRSPSDALPVVAVSVRAPPFSTMLPLARAASQATMMTTALKVTHLHVTLEPPPAGVGWRARL